MSSNYPPPPRPPAGQNPYGPQQYAPPAPGPYGVPGPYGAQAPGAPGAFNGYPPPAPAAAQRDNLGMGVLVGVAATIVAIFAYAGIMRAMAKDDGHYSEVGYVAIGVGLLIGAVMGKIGGRNPALPVIGLVLSVLGVFFGEIVGLS